VCSKNNEKIAKEVFIKHKEIVLKLEDFTIFTANFKDKATNIMEMSKILNLSLDSFVFVDDSKTECAIVKNNLPEVFVINLDPSNPSEYLNKIESYNLFYFKNTTVEDLDRKKSYKKIAEYKKIESNVTDIDKFLKGLNPKLSLNSINKKNSTRSSQLLAKTNQFKFNSKIFSEEELIKIKKRTLVISFKDDIQNYGIIGVVVFNIENKKKIIEIENFVLSCRVFSRRIENFILGLLVKKAKQSKCTQLYFKFDLTKKNFYLQEFLKEIGIIITKKKNEYKIDISSIINNKKQYIKLESF
jgi:FkbH-like protein